MPVCVFVCVFVCVCVCACVCVCVCVCAHDFTLSTLSYLQTQSLDLQ